MFIGEYSHSIDDKGRVILPAKLREELGSRVVISRGIDPCLYVYTTEGWETFSQKLSTLSLVNGDSRRMRQYMLSGADECEIDKQGRIVIPPRRREIFNGSRELMLVGQGSRIEIWEASKWNELISDIGNDIDSIAAGLAELGVSL